MISASSNKPAHQTDDEPEYRTADGYKTHLEHLNKRLKSHGSDAIYMSGRKTRFWDTSMSMLGFDS